MCVKTFDVLTSTNLGKGRFLTAWVGLGKRRAVLRAVWFGGMARLVCNMQ